MSADYLVDGTVIRWASPTACDAGRSCGMLERNTLTAAGLTALRILLSQDADLLAGPSVVERQIAPGTNPFMYGDIIAEGRPSLRRDASLLMDGA